jgi:hypothetical protein
MKQLSFVLTFFCIITINCSTTDPKRDRIIFEDDFGIVKDSMTTISQFMYLLKNSKGVEYYGFTLSGDFRIGNIKIGNLRNIYSDTLSIFRGMNDNTKSKFISVVMFLRRNHINRCSYYREFNRWCFSYRDIVVVNEDDYRLLILLKEDDKIEYFKKFVKILDTKENIILAKYQFD